MCDFVSVGVKKLLTVYSVQVEAISPMGREVSERDRQEGDKKGMK